MLWLLLGVLIWSGVHLLPSLAPALKGSWQSALGARGYAGSFAALIVLSMVLMVVGWRASEPTLLYALPPVVRHLAMLLVLIAFVLIGAAHYPSRLRRWVAHPMLAGVKVWAFAHLLVNGDSRSLVLFGGLLAWAVVQMIALNRRDGRPRPPPPGAISAELIGLGISVGLFGLTAVVLHRWLSGVALV